MNLKLKSYNLQRGQSLFEVVLALGVIAAITVGIVSLTVSSIRNAAFSKNKTLAGRYAQEAIEWLRSERDKNFTVFKTRVQTPPLKWCLTGPDLNWNKHSACGVSDYISGSPPLFREVTFSGSTISGSTIIRASVRVYWTDAQGAHEVTSTTLFSDWK